MPAAWYEDTDPQALEIFLQLHRRMTTGQRVARVFELTAFQEGLQRAFGAQDVSASRRTRSIFAGGCPRLDRETMIQVYGWDPDLHP
jgi:hypothetical protein